MCTPETRLHYVGGGVVLERKDRGFNQRLGPGSLPLHAGRFGMERVIALRKYADDPAVTITVAPGLTDLDQEVTILTLKTGQKPAEILPANHTTKYFIEKRQSLSAPNRTVARRSFAVKVARHQDGYQADRRQVNRLSSELSQCLLVR